MSLSNQRHYFTRHNNNHTRTYVIMTPSDKCKDFIKSYETLKLEKYDANPPNGDWTIGYGHKLLPDELSSGKINIKGETIDWTNGITKEQADKIFDDDIKNRGTNVVDGFITKHDLIVTQIQYDAATSFAYNTGNSRVEGLLLSMKNGNSNVREWLMGFSESSGTFDGIYRRRLDEYEIYTGRDYNQDDWSYVFDSEKITKSREQELYDEHKDRRNKAEAAW